MKEEKANVMTYIWIIDIIGISGFAGFGATIAFHNILIGYFFSGILGSLLFSIIFGKNDERRLNKNGKNNR